MSVTLGADPEFLLYNKNSHETIPCVGRIPGTKKKAHDLGDGFGVHEDNVAIELTVPVTTRISPFAEGIGKGKALIIEQFLKSSESLSLESAAKFQPSMLESKQAQEFGCEPDFDAYTAGKTRHVSNSVLNSRWRYAGGHIHIGGDFNCPPFVAALFADVFITLPSYYSNDISISPLTSLGRQRMTWYGRAGTFRAKPYGIEYRTPSNWWCRNNNTASTMADRALRLGHWLEGTSATGIRQALKDINWLNVQSVCNDPAKDSNVRQDQCDQLLNELSGIVPV